MRAGEVAVEPRGTKRKSEGAGFDDSELSEPALKIARHETDTGWQVQALLSAIEQGDEQQVALLLEQSPGLSSAFGPGPDGITPLCEAARQGHIGIANRLLSLGVPVDQPARNGSTPLMFAAQRGHIEAIQWLCMNGADPNHVNESALRTPLVFAIESENLAASQALISLGADPLRELSWVDPDSGKRKTQAPLTTAIRLDFAELLAWLLDTQKLTIDWREPVTNCTLLTSAANLGGASIVGMLAERGADLHREVRTVFGRKFNGIPQFASASIHLHVFERILRFLKTSRPDDLLKLGGDLTNGLAIDLLLHIDLWMNPKAQAADGLRDPVLRSHPEKLLQRMAEGGLFQKDLPVRLQWHSESGWLACLTASKVLLDQSIACVPILGSRAFQRLSQAGKAPRQASLTRAQSLQMLVEMTSISTNVHAPFSGRKLTAQTEQVMNRMFDLQLQLLLSAIKYHRSEFDRRLRTLPDLCVNRFISVSHSLNEPDLYRMLTKEWGLYDPDARAAIRLVGEAYSRLRALPPQQLPAAFAAMPPAERLGQVMIDLLDKEDKIPEIVEALRRADSTEVLDLLHDLLFQQWRLFSEAFGVIKPRYTQFDVREPELVDTQPQSNVDAVAAISEGPVPLTPQ